MPFSDRRFAPAPGMLFLFLLLVFLVGACSSSDVAPSPTTTPTEEPSPTSTPASTSTPEATIQPEQPWNIMGSPDAPLTIFEFSDFQ